MTFDSDARHRRSVRLPGYDYAKSGAYFITLCAFGRECLFGEIVEGQVRLNEIGEIVRHEWLRSPEIRSELQLDEWVIMPNHLHGIVVLTGTAQVPSEEGRTGRAPLHRRRRSLSSFIAGFKATSTKRIHDAGTVAGAPIWQRNYYEHVIRSEASLQAIRRYISENPLRWSDDEENPANLL